MYFVIIDLPQLNTRLHNCDSQSRSDTLERWLDRNGFRPTDNGWMASDEALNSLSCSEILACESMTSGASA